ncbi:MAG: polyprenol monophosphomannose synthase [Anaerolineae bacterium]
MVVLPTYNEAENLAEMVRQLLALDLPGLEVLIVDDNSPDGTGQIADDLSAQHPQRVRVLHRPGKGGLGTAYVAGFKVALAQGAERIVQMDADFSHSPSYVPILIANAEDADVVVGSRYVSGGKLDERWGVGRYFLSWWANSVYVRLILGLKVRDATAGFKCWRREALEGIDLDRIRSNGYVFQVEMAYICEKLGYRVREIPIYFEDRRIGRSKMSMPVKLEAAWRVWALRGRHQDLKPLPKRPGEVSSRAEE